VRYASAKTLGIRPARFADGGDPLRGRADALDLEAAGARQVILLPDEACEDPATAGLRFAAHPTDVAAARRRELSNDAPEPDLDGFHLGPARRGQLRLVLPKALLYTPAFDGCIATELLHVGGTGVLGSRGAGPDESGGDDCSDDQGSQ
jgi:hypothetical protein